jgi:preprotein translocase subunit YajC
MSFFISDALAEGGSAAQSGDLGALLFPIGLIVLLYFMMIRPQMKRQKEHKQLVDSLAKGDEVQIEAGIMGKITSITDDLVTLEIANGVEVKVRRLSVAAVLPKGTLADQ